ncbi:CSN-associated deubiquitinating enzyme Ubp12 [Tulasnella sp. 408]|nr:CSN-associated deubiquitinating enzyme Ubp12 [Tulasnella sp. 408]
MPSPDLTPREKLQKIRSLKSKPLTLGDTWYLVSRQWYRGWESACGDVPFEGAPEDENQVKAVDNSSLVGLKPGELNSAVIEGVDCELLPEEAWKLLVEWYGTPSQTFSRKVTAKGVSQLLSIDLYPISFLLYFCRNDNPPPPKPIEMSRAATLNALEETYIIPTLNQYQPLSLPSFRIWKVDATNINEEWDDRPGENEGYTPALVAKHNPSPLFGSVGSPFSPLTTTLEGAMVGHGDRIIIECTGGDEIIKVPVAWPYPIRSATVSPEEGPTLPPPDISVKASAQAPQARGGREAMVEGSIPTAPEEAISGASRIGPGSRAFRDMRLAQLPAESVPNLQGELLPRGGIGRPSPGQYMQVAVKRLRPVKITGYPDSYTIDQKLQKASILM